MIIIQHHPPPENVLLEKFTFIYFLAVHSCALTIVCGIWIVCGNVRSQLRHKTILQTCDNWDTDYKFYNWEPEFMTIFVTWQSTVTVDSTRNSCDVLTSFLAQLERSKNLFFTKNPSPTDRNLLRKNYNYSTTTLQAWRLLFHYVFCFLCIFVFVYLCICMLRGELQWKELTIQRPVGREGGLGHCDSGLD